MTDDDKTPTSAAALNAELAALLRRARDNDVDVRGGWTCSADTDGLDWDVVVTEVKTADRAE
jgi:hypothetical protein